MAAVITGSAASGPFARRRRARSILAAGLCGLLIAAAAVWTGSARAAERVHVAVFSPENVGDPFWARTLDFMEAAAADLGVFLESHHADGDLEAMRAQIERVLTRDDRPDYVVFPASERVGPYLLDLAERYGVYALLMNAGLSDDQRDVTGGPRVRYSRWLGQIMPDDLLGGYLLARNMFRHAHGRGLTGPSGRIQLIGMTNSAADERALDRIAGLELAAKEYYRGDIAYMGLAGGSKSKAQQVLQRGYEANPGATLFWSTDDMMALGMIEALTKRTRRLPGSDVVVGGFYWSPWALQSVVDGRLSFLMGGHFMTGGAAIVMLYDHAMGKDFAEIGKEQRLGFGLLHAGNIRQLAPVLAQRNWSWVDFRRFSRALNPERGDYNFSASAFLQARKQ
eukprot:g13830.t1